jgi:lysophospholipase L1-like esterase
VLCLYKKLVRQVAERNPGTPLFWIETTPTPSRWGVISEIRQANGLIREYCERHPGLYFVDTYASFMNPQSFPDSTLFNRDMLHLNREGYRLWAGIIQESLHQAGIDPVP